MDTEIEKMNREQLMAMLEVAKVELNKQEGIINKCNQHLCLLNDDKSQYRESVEVYTTSKRPKRYGSALVGRMYWKECFRDESTGEYIWIERSEVVLVNGKWQSYVFNEDLTEATLGQFNDYQKKNKKVGLDSKPKNKIWKNLLNCRMEQLPL